MAGPASRDLAVAGAAAAALGAAAAAWALRPRRGGWEAYANAPDGQADTIFVSVASYRDRECGATVRDLFAKASRPGRVRVGVVEQNSGDAAEACLGAGFARHAQVRRVTIPHGEAKGPTYARALAAGLYRGEAFFMQIDSHTRFAQGWDEGCIADLRKCASDKPVLTHYPPEWSSYGKPDADARVPVLCKSSWNAKGILSFEAVLLPAADEPRRVPFVAGGFVFAPGRVVREVPFDGSLEHLFVGEEILWSARAWTTGWDFFTPTKNWVYHFYDRADEPKFWSDVDYSAQMAETERRVRRLLRGGGDDRAFGMGSARTLAEYWAFAGVDPAAKTSASAAKFCS